MLSESLGQGATRALLAVFNHVLSQHQWARDKLGMHAGRTVRLGLEQDNLPKLPFLPPPEIQAQITPEGYLEALLNSATVVENPSVEMHIKPGFEALSSFSKDGPQGLLKHMKIEGDVMLAAALGEIASQARWDYEDDLSKVVGDVAARRAGRLVDDTRYALQDGAQFARGRVDALRAREAFPLPGRDMLGQMDQRISDLGRRLDALSQNLKARQGT